MATTATADGDIQIAGKGHVYFAEPGTEAPDLWAYTFGDGTTLEAEGWSWAGDTSSENLVAFEKDGGDTATKDTWDRKGARSTRESTTHKVTINSVSMNADLVRVAFPGSTYDANVGGWDLNLDGSIDKAVLIVVEDNGGVSGMLLRRVNLAGALPTLSKEDFTEIALSGVLLAPSNGKAVYQLLEPRKTTGKAAAAPTVTSLNPDTAKASARIEVNGTNFAGTRSVTIGGKPAAFELVTGTQLKVTVPQIAAGQHDVVVTNGKGKSADGKKLTVTA